MKKLKILILSIIAVMLVCASYAGFANTGGYQRGPADSFLQDEGDQPSKLPVIGTADNLKRMVKDSLRFNQVYYTRAVDDGAMKSAENAPQNTVSNSAADYSTTNVQVQGVDEADTVKTDGEYIYQVNNQVITIVRAYPAQEMEVKSIIDYRNSNFYPCEIYVGRDTLTVIGQSSRDTKYNIQQNGFNKPGFYGMNLTSIFVYDIKDKKNPVEVRRTDIEGSILSSRMIGTKLYIVCNKYLDYYLMEQGTINPAPSYRDSTGTGEYKTVGYEDIKYFPEAACNNFMIIGAMDVSNKDEVKIDTYLGAGQNIYVSSDNLYAAVTRYQALDSSGASDNRAANDIVPRQYTENTSVYKFSLKDCNTAYTASGEVPGHILNQFSMDEYNSYFRIATTSGETWWNGSSISKNNVYVLDKKMNVKGKIEDIAPGEKIYSVRFMGDRGYIVTFKTVDPLFVLDFKNPENPGILGALKIPGYSNYLHPYDENHIIGFGKDTTEVPVKDGTSNTMGFYLGMKIAIFDVTDVNHPVQMFSENIGDRGTDSEILYNHKALLFSKENNLLAFPVNLLELKENQQIIDSQRNIPQYGTFTYQGAYVYNIDLIKGFTLKGRITHISDEEYKKSGQGWYNGYNGVERILYIDNTLYTISKGMIKASSMDNLAKINEVKLELNK